MRVVAKVAKLQNRIGQNEEAIMQIKQRNSTSKLALVETDWST